MVTSLEKHKSLAEFERPLDGQGEENLIILTVKAPFSSLPLRHVLSFCPHAPAGEEIDGKVHWGLLTDFGSGCKCEIVAIVALCTCMESKVSEIMRNKSLLELEADILEKGVIKLWKE